MYDATCGRLFTAWYGFGMRRIDELGLRETRRAALATASGRTLEIGSGTGCNVSLYPDAVEDLILAEPDAHMQKALRRRVEEDGASVSEIVQATAEELPFESSSLDCVACTMVLCTVPEPMEALAEIARVLKPGGSFLFMEHVRSEDPKFARKQDRMERPWRFLADGCHCNRDSLATIQASPLEVESFWRGTMPAGPLFMRPLVSGRAVAPG